MSLKALCRGLLAVAALVALAGGAFAQSNLNYFYNEVAKDGRIYVFANGSRFDTFQKSGGAEIGTGDHAAGLRPERRDRGLRLRGRDQPLQLQARHARRVLREAEGDAEAGRQLQDQGRHDDLRRLHLHGRAEDHGRRQELGQHEQLRGPPGLHQRDRQHHRRGRLPRHARTSRLRQTTTAIRSPVGRLGRPATSTAAWSSASSTPSASSTSTRCATHGSWIRIGQQQTPYVDFMEGIYRYRFQGTIFVGARGLPELLRRGPLRPLVASRTTTATSTLGYYNGDTYSKAEVNDQKAFQIRATLRPLPEAGRASRACA